MKYWPDPTVRSTCRYQEQKKDPLPTHLFGPHPNSPFRRGGLSASRLLPSVSVPDGCGARSPAPLSSVYEGVAVGSSYFLFVWRELDRLAELRHDDKASVSLPYADCSSLFMSSVSFFFFGALYSLSLTFSLKERSSQIRSPQRSFLSPSYVHTTASDRISCVSSSFIIFQQ